MANSIALAQNFLGVLDAVYKDASLTAPLDAAPGTVDFTGADTCKIYKLEMDGLGDYSRNSGYPTGSVTGTWETLQLTKDRAVMLEVDRFDNEESRNMAFGMLASEFMRTQVVPELDAYRFASYAAAAGNVATAADITVGTTDCVGLIDAAETDLLEDEVPIEGRILFVSPTMYAGIKAKVSRSLANENGVQRNIETFDNMPVVVVPQSRFATAITLYDGSANFGYVPTASTGYDINFMIVHPSAVKNVVKGDITKVFSPDEYQAKDAWAFAYRLYHDAFVFDNKADGIYLHAAATPIS